MAFNTTPVYVGPLVGGDVGSPNQGNSMYVQRAVLASRPAVGNKGVFFIASDDANGERLYWDDGAAWVDLGLIVTGGAQTFAGAKTWSGKQIWSEGAAIASAAALTPGSDGNFFHVTGAVGITSIAAAAPSPLFLVFDSTPTLTHNATSLILQGAVNLVAAAGDVVAFVHEGGGNWRELSRRLAAAASTTTTLETALKNAINDNVSMAFYALGPADNVNITASDVRVGWGFASFLPAGTGTISPSTLMRGGWRMAGDDPTGWIGFRTAKQLGVGQDWIITARVRVEGVNGRFFLGLTDSVVADPQTNNDCIGLRESANAAFEFVCDSAGTETVRATADLPGAADHRVRIEISANGTVVKFFWDGTQVGADVTTNIPTMNTMTLTVGARDGGVNTFQSVSDLFAWREI